VDVAFVSPDPRRLDDLRSEALLLPAYEDERPLRGVAGWVDWRMCGQLSRLVLRGRITGRLGETVLLPGRPKVSFDKVFVFGAGATDTLDAGRTEALVRRMLHAAARARVRVPTMVLPGRHPHRLQATDAIAAFLAATTEQAPLDDVVLVEDGEAQRAMEPVIERERRRARAALATAALDE
jgi:hypothetical protein